MVCPLTRGKGKTWINNDATPQRKTVIRQFLSKSKSGLQKPLGALAAGAGTKECWIESQGTKKSVVSGPPMRGGETAVPEKKLVVADKTAFSLFEERGGKKVGGRGRGARRKGISRC